MPAVWTSPNRFCFENANYNADWRDAERRGEHFYRSDHPLAQQMTAEALQQPADPTNVVLHYGAHGRKISTVQSFVGLSGWLTVSRLAVNSFEVEEHLLLAGITNDGDVLDEDVCRKLLTLPATRPDPTPVTLDPASATQLEHGLASGVKHYLAEVERRKKAGGERG